MANAFRRTKKSLAVPAIFIPLLSLYLAACGDRLNEAEQQLGIKKDEASATREDKDGMPPSVVEKLTASAGGAFRITLNWNAATDNLGPEGLTSYRISRDDVFLTEIPGSVTVYEDSGLKPLTTYSYRVEAVDSSSNASAPSNAASATTTAIAGSDLYAINCSGCHGDLALSTKRDRSLSEIRASLRSIPAMLFLEAKLSTADVEAIAAALSNKVVDQTPPSQMNAPTLEVVGPSAITVNWLAAVEDASGSGLSAYRILRNDSKVAEVAGDMLSWTDTGLDANTEYSYKIIAVDKAGNASVTSDAAKARTRRAPSGVDTTPPPVPAGLNATVLSSTRVSLTWDSVNDEDGGSGLKSWRILRNGEIIREVSLSPRTLVDTDLAAATSYAWSIVAVDNASNASAPSAPVLASTPAADGAALYNAHCKSCHSTATSSNAVTQSTKRNRTVAQIEAAVNTVPTMNSLIILGRDEVAAIATVLADAADSAAPTVPSNLAATAPNATTVRLTWNVSTDNGSGVVSYRIFRSGSFVKDVEHVAGLTSLEAIDGSRMPLTDYSYTLEARDAAGNRSAQTTPVTVRTPEANATPDTLAPAVPGNFRGAAIDHRGIRLTWDAAVDNQGGSGVKAYRVFRNGVTLPDVEAPALTLDDRSDGLQPDTAYTYTISALDNAGNRSSLSTELTVQTAMVDGNALYAANCASCHNPLATSVKLHRSAATILAAISGSGAVPSMMGLSYLTTTEISAIAESLRDKTAPTTPVALTATAVNHTTVNLSWSASTDVGGSLLKDYALYRNDTLVTRINAPVTTFSDTGRSPATQYSYKIEAQDFGGNVSVRSSVTTVTTPVEPAAPDTTPPSKPSGLLATATAWNTIRLAWTVTNDAGGSGLASYRIMRGTTVVATIPATSNPSYNVSGLQPLTAYSHSIIAVDGAGNLSVQSALASATTLQLDGANVYATNCASCHNPLNTTTKANRTVAQITGAITGSRSVPSMAGLSTLSTFEIAAIAAVLRDAIPPSTPTGFAAAAANHTTVNLSWTASTDTGGSLLKEYVLYRNGVVRMRVTPPISSFQDTGLTAQTSYSYDIEAVDNNNNVSQRPTTRTVTTTAAPPAPDTTPPSAPSNLLASAPSSDSLTLSWSVAQDTGGSGLASYRIMRGTATVATIAAVANPQYVVTGLQPSTSYTHKVVAIDGAGNPSPASNAVTASTKAIDGVALYAGECASCHNSFATSTKLNKSAAQISGAITSVVQMSSRAGLTGLSAAQVAAISLALRDTKLPSIPTNLQGSAQSSTSINLTWGVSTDAGGSGLASYKIWLGNTLVRTVTAPNNSGVVTGLTADTDYTFTVSAVDGNQNESAKSTARMVRTQPAVIIDNTAPPIPTGLTVTVNNYEQISVRWAAVVDNAGGSGIKHYVLHRNNVVVATVNAPGVEFVDRNRAPSTNHDYKVSAVDIAGNASAFSAIVRGTTPAINGGVLYASKCASCHGPLASSGKRGATEALIQFGLSNQTAMKSLSLSTYEVAAIATALRPVAPPVNQRPDIFEYAAPVGTRQLVGSRLSYAFLPDAVDPANNAHKAIAGRIKSFIFDQPANMGGPCGRYDGAGNCFGEGQLFITIEAPMAPVTSPARRGFIARTCDDASSLFEAGVSNVLSRAGGLTSASAATNANVTAVYRVFYPGYTPAANVLTALRNLHAEALTLNYGNSAAWRHVVNAVCDSAGVDSL